MKRMMKKLNGEDADEDEASALFNEEVEEVAALVLDCGSGVWEADFADTNRQGQPYHLSSRERRSPTAG